MLTPSTTSTSFVFETVFFSGGASYRVIRDMCFLLTWTGSDDFLISCTIATFVGTKAFSTALTLVYCDMMLTTPF